MAGVRTAKVLLIKQLGVHQKAVCLFKLGILIALSVEGVHDIDASEIFTGNAVDIIRLPLDPV